jgi:hypothetical protein
MRGQNHQASITISLRPSASNNVAEAKADALIKEFDQAIRTKLRIYPIDSDIKQFMESDQVLSIFRRAEKEEELRDACIGQLAKSEAGLHRDAAKTLALRGIENGDWGHLGELDLGELADIDPTMADNVNKGIKKETAAVVADKISNKEDIDLAEAQELGRDRFFANVIVAADSVIVTRSAFNSQQSLVESFLTLPQPVVERALQALPKKKRYTPTARRIATEMLARGDWGQLPDIEVDYEEGQTAQAIADSLGLSEKESEPLTKNRFALHSPEELTRKAVGIETLRRLHEKESIDPKEIAEIAGAEAEKDLKNQEVNSEGFTRSLAILIRSNNHLDELYKARLKERIDNHVGRGQKNLKKELLTSCQWLSLRDRASCQFTQQFINDLKPNDPEPVVDKVTETILEDAISSWPSR